LGKAILEIESKIKEISGKSVAYMVDPHLGNLTCCPSNIGTGMRASVHMLIPKLLNKYNKDIEQIQKDVATEFNC